MKSNFKILGTIALAAVGASMAHANASSYASGYSAAAYYESAPGIYGSLSGEYPSYGNYSTGSNWYGVDYLYDNNGASQYNHAYGQSYAWDSVGGSGFAASLSGSNSVTWTNYSSNWDLLSIEVVTTGLAESYSSSWNNYAGAEGGGVFYDSSGQIFQESAAEALTYGRGLGGDYAAAYNYDIYNGGSYASYFGGNQFPFSLYGSASDTQWYYVYLAPGTSDTFTSYAFETHTAYATTPGPVAVAPFALGLIGALRRRKKA